jgi:hypothetical protein
MELSLLWGGVVHLATKHLRDDPQFRDLHVNGVA